ncbi:MAG: hypothetical protein IPH30_01300 [Betaproteobacteria bacterium]|nr:hypothetical protein [Betaproteobacteria bacterium]
MNFEPLRRLQTKLSVAFLAAGALILTSCGGGGATGSPAAAGNLQLLPGAATIYAGVPYTVNIVGGRPPYLVTSNEQTLIELNFTTSSNSFQFVARNPGVVDVGLDPDEVPRRSVIIEVRDSNGASTSNTYSVLQNFFTGYRESYQSTCASGGGAGAVAPPACSGTDTLITIFPVSNGTLYGNREFQFDRVRGTYSFVEPDPATIPQLVDRIRVRTDQEGKAIVRMRVAAAAPTQLATYKVTDILTGVTTDLVVLIVQQSVVDTISLVPATLEFTGGLSTQCGAGTADVFVFGGTPPYSVTASAGLAVSPTTVTASGGKISVTAGSTSPPCPANGSVIVTDSGGAVGTLPVTLVAGGGTPTPLAASPTTIANLNCGNSVQVTLIGGVGGLSSTSTHPRITSTISATSLTMTRLAGDGATVYPATGSVTVTDGASIVTVTITATPANCP